ncbi:conserved protein of unknown function [Pseudomonas marincola]|uniref:Uncharacterized protein n=1 Tax=Pseudomonas marincola TaxID=437900 RepID=A0A653E6A1_9PSED|nr:conserved protein of unknown function [Pseudomonas marincola]
MIRMAADNGMIFQFAKQAGKSYMLSTANILISQKQHAMLKQLGADLSEQAGIMNCIGKINAQQLCSNVAGQLFNLHD